MNIENLNYRAAIFCILLLLFIPNCAPQSLYTWNGYDQSVYDYYENPGEREEFVMKLEKTILVAEANGNIPPGLYAEYGYIFYEVGDFSNAAGYFKKEKEVWPESTIFMNKMIRNCELQDKRNSKTSPDSVKNTEESQ